MSQSTSSFIFKVIALFACLVFHVEGRHAVAETATDDNSSKAFQASLSGALSGDISGTASAIRYQDGATVMTLNEGVSGKTLVITLPASTSIGDYPMKSFGEAYQGNRKVLDYGASYSQVKSEAEKSVISFTKVTEGTLRIKSLEPLSGDFRISFESDKGEKLQISGEFQNVPLARVPY